MEGNGFHDWREWRRLRAADLLRRGWPQKAIAAALGVSEGAVSQWAALLRGGGRAALRSRPHPGHGKLSPAQRRLLPDFLWHGAEAYGFRGDVWTCARIAKVIDEEFGVRYHRHHVARLPQGLGWTPQVPITRAIQRDERAIRRWRAEAWPRLRARARCERRAPVFVDESGFYLLPGVVRTYGPKGETPVVYHWLTRDHLSVMAAVTAPGKVYTLVRKEPLNGAHSIEFLQHLLRHLPAPLLVIWDGSPIHRRAEVGAFARAVGERRLLLEPLPPYAPDLNPVEWLWEHLKKVELRNKTCLDLEELHSELHLAVDRVRQRSGLVRSFFEGAGLTL
jgi:transposase